MNVNARGRVRASNSLERSQESPAMLATNILFLESVYALRCLSHE